jgi:hypothetical protein
LITRGEGWLAEVEPSLPDQQSDEGGVDDGTDDDLVRREEQEDEVEDDDEMTPEEEERWKDYHERENVLKDASALISSLAGCAGKLQVQRSHLLVL